MSNDEDLLQALNPLRFATCPKALQVFSEGDCKKDGRNVFDPLPILEFYSKNGIFKQAVDTPANDALRYGIQINAHNKQLFEETLTKLDYIQWLTKATKQARLFGYCLVLMKIDDGQYIDNNGKKQIDHSKPVNENAIKDINFLHIYTPNEFQISDGTDDPDGAPDYPFEWNYYNITVTTKKQIGIESLQKILKIHKSRALFISNDSLFTDAINLQSSSSSLFFRLFKPITLYDIVCESVGADAANSQLDILKVDFEEAYKNSKNDDERAQLMTFIEMRRRMLEIFRRNKNIAVLDKEEEFETKKSSLNGYSDIITKLEKRIASSCDVINQILFPERSTGLSNNGDKDLEVYYNNVVSIQENLLRPALTYILHLIQQWRFPDVLQPQKAELKSSTGFFSKVKEFFTSSLERIENVDGRSQRKRLLTDKIAFTFNPIWQESRLEKIEAEKLITDQYISLKNADLLTAEQIQKQSDFDKFFQHEDNNDRS